MIRMAREADVQSILDIYAPYVQNTTISFEYSVPDFDTFLQRFRTVTAQFPWLVWEENGLILGYAYASPPYTRAAYAWCAEPSIYLSPQARGRGVGRALYAALEQILTAQGYQVLYALITAENRDSLRFHEKMGYTLRVRFPRCGFKFGRWIDLIWMEKRLNFVENPGDPPMKWSHVSNSVQITGGISDIFPLS